MTIKSLLLGSAAALVAVSGARAADAIIAEPEPVEYVRVCDAYGAGFFYIPGTETCLRISGYVWLQISTAQSATAVSSTSYYGPAGAFGWSSRARVNFDARSDTEWGTLRSYIRLQATWTAAGVGDGPTTVDQAFIELGGFRLGYTESAWVTSQSVGVGQFGSHSWGGMYYGYQQRQLISYTFAGNGFAATLSLEDDTTADYMPDVVGVVSYNAGWGGVWAKAGFDNDILTVVGTPSGWGAQLGAQLNVPNSPGSSLRLIYFYANSPNSYGVAGPGCVACVAPIIYEHSILASYNHQFNAQFGASVAFQYFANAYHPATGVKFTNDAWGAELSLVYTPVTNFEVRAEIHYDDMAGGTGLAFNPTGRLSGFLRFTRSF